MGATEKHYTVQQVAKMWGYSDETIRRLFKDEKGVLKIGRAGTRFRRQRWQMSIPESVLIRVHNQRSN